MIKAQIKFEDGKGITKISLVDKGANQEKLLKLAKQKPILKLSYDEDKQEITGIVLIPDQLIYRDNEFFIKTIGIDDDGYIFFTADDIKLFVKDYLNNSENSFNLNHSDDVEDGSILLLESWIVGKNDKIYDLGFDKETVIMGSWAMTQHILDMELWEDIRDGKYNSFSIEGSPIVEQIMLSIQYSDDQIVNEIVKLIVENNK